MKLNHIGIAVENLEAASADFKRLGFEVSPTEIQAADGVKLAFIQIGDTRLELLEPIQNESGEASAIAGFLKKRGPGLHHLAIEVEDVNEKLDALTKNNVRLIDKKARTGAHNTDVAFLHPKATSAKVLIEFCAPKAKPES
jgi:methylmalonyl-CoA/ethylmalonyl-CoA epimerase